MPGGRPHGSRIPAPAVRHRRRIQHPSIPSFTQQIFTGSHWAPRSDPDMRDAGWTQAAEALTPHRLHTVGVTDKAGSPPSIPVTLSAARETGAPWSVHRPCWAGRQREGELLQGKGHLPLSFPNWGLSPLLPPPLPPPPQVLWEIFPSLGLSRHLPGRLPAVL